MGEAAAEELLHRRIEFHAATRPRPPAASAAAMPGGFRMERSLFAAADNRVAAAWGGPEGKMFDNGESSGGGFQLSAARFYLRRIGAGLHNLGNTCYLNSVLQCLTYTEPFVAYLQSSKHRSSCQTPGFCALCALQNHVRSALQSTGKILTPMQFVKNLRCISRSFCNSRQEDAHELMVSLLESMHKCSLPSGIPSESPSAYEKSLVHRIFGGRLRSQVRCTRCSHCSNKFDPFLDLSLEIGNATTLMKALYNFTEEELLDGGEKHYSCTRCKQKVAAKKRFLIDKVPSVLTIHLKRFSPFNPLQKIDKKVDFQTTLNLKPFVSNSEGTDLKYSLYGVLVHAGWNTQSGHYYCFVRTSSGLWHNLDDNKVHQVREADVLRQKAYMLFYVRDEVRNSVIHRGNGAASLSEKERISKKIACMNGAIRSGLMEKTLYFPSISKEDMKLQKHDPDNGQPSDITATSQGQCSNEHSTTEVINASTSKNNEPEEKAPHALPDGADTLSTKAEQIALGVQREIISPGQPDVCILEMRSQKLNPDNGQSNNSSASSQEQCSHEHGNTEVTKDSTSQNNEPVQKASCSHVAATATFSTKTEQTALINQRETISTAQPDVCIICDASSDQKVYEKPLQELQLEPDGALTDSGKDFPASAQPDACSLCDASSDQKAHEKPLQDLQLEPDGALTDSGKDTPASVFESCNGADGLLRANKQTNEPRIDAFCKPCPNSDATIIAPVVLTEDTAVSDDTITGNEDSTHGIEAKGTEPVKQYDGLIVVKELSVETIDDKVKAEEQTAVQNNTLGDGQSMVKEVSLMETGHMADAEYQVVDKDRGPRHGSLHKNIKIKSKKHVNYPAANFYFGSKQLLLASLKPRKKRKHKRTRRLSTSDVNPESIANDQQTSTSETVLSSGISCKSQRRKHSHNTASSEDAIHMYKKKQNVGNSCAAELTIDKEVSKDATFAGAELGSSFRSCVSNPDAGKCGDTDKKGSWHFDLLTRGLRVPRWDDDDMRNTKAAELQYSSATSIGYVLDEWDEEYDRGRTKKVRKSKRDFSGPNPFQEVENIRSRQRRRLQTDQIRSGHGPLRI